MVTTKEVYGIDVSRQWLDVVTLPRGAYQRVANDAEGWAVLSQQVRAHPPACIVLEATGGYEQGVAAALDAAGMTPVIAHPLHTRHFAQSRGCRAKTDRVDARLLAEFGVERRPVPRPLPTAHEVQARALITRRRQLTAMLAQEQTRRQQAAPCILASLDALIATLTEARRGIDAALAQVVTSDPALQARVERWRTVPGIGTYTATVLAAELPQLGDWTAKELTSLLGVAPIACDSGQRHRARRIGGGKGWIRALLYQVILSTIRCDPTFAAYYRQLRTRPTPKPGNVARIACIRKLLGILTAMARDNLTWQDTEVGQGRFLAAAA
jgi:transposase